MAEIIKISGPVVISSGMRGSKMCDVVKVGNQKLMGEIIQLKGDTAVIQVYEDTIGLRPGEQIIRIDEPLSIELGPGLLGAILDGVGRPLNMIASNSGDFIAKGIDIPTLPRDRQYEFTPLVNVRAYLKPGQILGYIQETEIIQHKILVPPNIEGKLIEIFAGKYRINEIFAKIQADEKIFELTLVHRWPVRKPRPVKEKLSPSEPLISGQRVFDTFFPLVKGGTAAIPGPFGAGKTVSQHQLAKWVDADVVVYIGCGERGNEMTEVLKEFPELIDPKTKRHLMERTVLIANTSNMPVAAREASIYTGITIAEYFRDMGYNVALMADSTSRWAEALREISFRLEEMPGEEAYPAYLSSRLAQFYERSGKFLTLNDSQSSISIIGAVSPQGGDFSEPVTQNTLRITKVFWALDAPLAYKRHFPAINWLTSYSLYADQLYNYYNSVGEDYNKLIKKALYLLQKETELQEIVQLVGPDALPEEEKLILDAAKKLREDFLQQNAYHEIDSYCEPKKQYMMLKAIISYYNKLLTLIHKGAKLSHLQNPQLDEQIARMKYQKEYADYINSLLKNIDEVA